MASLSLVFDIIARDKASKEFKNVGDAADDTGKKASKFGPAIAAGAAVAVAAVVSFGKSSVTAYSEAEQSSLRLDEALKKFPATNDRSRASFDSLNEALAKKTRFDDDATASGQAVLAQFKLTGSQIQELTPLLQDYAAKTGKDLPTAALDLGKAIQGQGRALKEVGLDLKDTGSKTGNLDQLTKGLRSQVGGFATAEGKTAAGAAAILGNRFGEVQEKVGSKLTPALTTLANKLIQVIDFVERNQRVVVPLVAVLGGLAAVIVTINAAAKAYTAVQAALNVVLAANPVGLVVLAIAGLVAGIVIAYKKSETFRDIVNGALDAVKTAFVALATGALGVISKILGGYQSLAEAAGKLPGPLGAPFRAAAEAIGGAKAKVDALKSGISTLTGKTVDVNADTARAQSNLAAVRAGLGALYDRTVTVTTIQKTVYVAQRDGEGGGLQARASGGPVNAFQPYLVGERGPELIVPPRDGYVLNAGRTRDALSGGGGGGGGGNSYTIQTTATDPAQLVGLLRRMEALNA